MQYERTLLSQFLRLRAPDVTTVLLPVNCYNFFSPHSAACTLPNENPEHRPDTIRGFNWLQSYKIYLILSDQT